MQINNKYKDAKYIHYVTDLGLAIALLCLDHELITLEKKDSKKSIFLFRKREDTEKIENKYFSNKLEVKARDFWDHSRALKSKLYSA
ncbi:MAG: DUF5659 domain-containing protein [Candidatus Nomurabacteria bacterium]